MATSTSSVQTAVAGPPRPARTLVVQRLMGLLGLLMLGPFTVVHLAGLLPMLTGGADAFNATLAVRQSTLLGGLTLAWVLPPLLLHGAYGLWRLKVLRSNVGRFPTRANWVHSLQRWMGPPILVFLVFHVWSLRVAPWIRGQSVDAHHVSRHLSSMLTLDLYVLGVGAVAFHLAAGAWNLLIRWGVLTGEVAQRRAARVLAVLGVLLALWGVLTAAAFHDGKFVLP